MAEGKAVAKGGEVPGGPKCGDESGGSKKMGPRQLGTKPEPRPHPPTSFHPPGGPRALDTGMSLHKVWQRWFQTGRAAQGLVGSLQWDFLVPGEGWLGLWLGQRP